MRAIMNRLNPRKSAEPVKPTEPQGATTDDITKVLKDAGFRTEMTPEEQAEFDAWINQIKASMRGPHN